MEPTTDQNPIRPPVLALDLGTKRVGVAVCDSLSVSISRLVALQRTNWKQLLRDVDDLIRHYDAQTVVIGLPLNINGSEGEAATEARAIAAKFARSLIVPVYLQDERLSSVAAESNLRGQGHKSEQVSELVDSEAAAVILSDFLDTNQARILVTHT